MEIKTVGVVLFQDDCVLLVKHLEGGGHAADTYGLPAGKLEAGEDFVQAGVRELREETGLVTEPQYMSELPTSYHADVPRKDGSAKPMFMKAFLCSQWSGSLRLDSTETLPQWVPISTLQSLPLILNVHNVIQEALRFKV